MCSNHISAAKIKQKLKNMGIKKIGIIGHNISAFAQTIDAKLVNDQVTKINEFVDLKNKDVQNHIDMINSEFNGTNRTPYNPDRHIKHSYKEIITEDNSQGYRSAHSEWICDCGRKL